MKNTQETKPQNSELPVSSGNNQEIIRDNKGRFVPGVSGNPKGVPVGTVSFKTEFRRAIKKIAQANKINEDEAMDILHRVGYGEAKNANFPFFKDIMDRYYGKPQGDVPNVAVQVNIKQDIEEYS